MSKIQFNLRDLFIVCIKEGFISPDVEYKTFSTIIREFNIDISTEILKGYKFSPGSRLGIFNLIKDIRRGKTVNWGESNKYRQRLIDQGKVPFDKELAPHGEEWLIFYTDNTYYKWKWFKNGASQYVKHIGNFVFKPVTANRRNIAKVVKEDKFIPENYVTYK